MSVLGSFLKQEMAGKLTNNL